MFLFVVLAAAVVLAVILGGDVRRLSLIRLKHPYVLVAAFTGRAGVAILGFVHSSLAVNIARPLNLVVAGLLILFVWFNWRLPGAILFGAGQSLNLAALLAFGGRMPVLLPADADRLSSRLALLTSGLDPLHVLLPARQGLWFLGDIFTIPFLGRSSVVSVGDIMMAAAVGWLVVRRSQRQPDPETAYGPSAAR